MTKEQQHDTTLGRPLHGWLWFMLGFSLVFVLLLFKTSTVPNLAGNAIVRCALWQHYAIEIQRQFRPQYLGPFHNSGNATRMTFLMHLALASAGGLASFGIAAVWRRARR